jgi:hypothetical protein
MRISINSSSTSFLPKFTSKLTFLILSRESLVNLGRVSARTGGVGRNFFSCPAYRKYKERE